MKEHPNLVNDNDLDWGEQTHGDKFGYRRKQLSSASGGEKLGCSLYEVPPGRRAWSYRYHLANEEAIYVLEGSGTLKGSARGDRRFTRRPRDARHRRGGSAPNPQHL